jgi:cystathionine beta-lyase/cystathionine gamma-synthase
MAATKERKPGAFDTLPEWAGPSTRLVHAGRRPERNAGAVVPPIYQTSTFHFPERYSDARTTGRTYIYTRYDNPTQEAAAEPVRLLEGAGAARVFGSGMAAISSTLLSFLGPGDEVVALEDLYGGTLDLLSQFLPRFGITVRWVPAAQAAEPERLASSATRMFYLETPTNPLLHVHDVKRWAEAADASGALLVVDNTFATPVNQTPIALGADLVIHSATKYLGGHSDIIAGVLAGPAELVERVRRTHLLLGAPLDPFAAFLLARGLKTLALRVERQNATGARVAQALRTMPGVARVYYPGMGSDAEEAIASRQMRGRGGMVAFSLSGGLESAHRFLDRLRLVHVAASLGGVESLVSLPMETSHAHLSPDERAARGLDDGLVRLSLGIEEPDDLLRDLSNALVGEAGRPSGEQPL